MMGIETLTKKALHLVTDNSPVILTGLATAGVVTTAVMAAKAVPRALNSVWEAESEFTEPITAKQKVQLTWRYFVPAGIMGSATIACIIGAHTISTRRSAALASAFALSETAFKEYREKAVEVAGKAKEKAIREGVAQDKVNEAEGASEIVLLGGDDILCFDTYTSRFFKSSKNALEKAEVEINRRILNEMYASLNDWYNLIGLKTVSEGDNLGWNNDHPLELIFSAVFEEGKPVAAIDYRFSPRPDFSRVW